MSLQSNENNQKPSLSGSDERNMTEFENKFGDVSFGDEDILLPDMALQEYRHQEGPTTKLCRRCSSMTSTLAGLTALTSDGYVHRERKGLEQSANRGCKLCTILVTESEYLWDTVEEGHELTLWADVPEDYIQHTAGSSTYPLNDIKLGKIRGSVGSSLRAITFSGEDSYSASFDDYSN